MTSINDKYAGTRNSMCHETSRIEAKIKVKKKKSENEEKPKGERHTKEN